MLTIQQQKKIIYDYWANRFDPIHGAFRMHWGSPK